ncbi:hypothetical protein N2152v2_000384 [Parachlorella kessleri]
MEGGRPQSIPVPHASGRKRTKAGRYAADITWEELESCFHLPTDQACKELGVGLTIFKRICRRFGLERWPYKKPSKAGTAQSQGSSRAAAPSRDSVQQQQQQQQPQSSHGPTAPAVGAPGPLPTNPPQSQAAALAVVSPFGASIGGVPAAGSTPAAAVAPGFHRPSAATSAAAAAAAPPEAGPARGPAVGNGPPGLLGGEAQVEGIPEDSRVSAPQARDLGAGASTASSRPPPRRRLADAKGERPLLRSQHEQQPGLRPQQRQRHQAQLQPSSRQRQHQLQRQREGSAGGEATQEEEEDTEATQEEVDTEATELEMPEEADAGGEVQGRLQQQPRQKRRRQEDTPALAAAAAAVVASHGAHKLSALLAVIDQSEMRESGFGSVILPSPPLSSKPSLDLSAPVPLPSRLHSGRLDALLKLGGPTLAATGAAVAVAERPAAVAVAAESAGLDAGGSAGDSGGTGPSLTAKAAVSLPQKQQQQQQRPGEEAGRLPDTWPYSTLREVLGGQHTQHAQQAQPNAVQQAQHQPHDPLASPTTATALASLAGSGEEGPSAPLLHLATMLRGSPRMAKQLMLALAALGVPLPSPAQQPQRQPSGSGRAAPELEQLCRMLSSIAAEGSLPPTGRRPTAAGTAGAAGYSSRVALQAVRQPSAPAALGSASPPPPLAMAAAPVAADVVVAASGGAAGAGATPGAGAPFTSPQCAGGGWTAFAAGEGSGPWTLSGSPAPIGTAAQGSGSGDGNLRLSAFRPFASLNSGHSQDTQVSLDPAVLRLLSWSSATLPSFDSLQANAGRLGSSQGQLLSLTAADRGGSAPAPLARHPSQQAQRFSQQHGGGYQGHQHAQQGRDVAQHAQQLLPQQLRLLAGLQQAQRAEAEAAALEHATGLHPTPFQQALPGQPQQQGSPGGASGARLPGSHQHAAQVPPPHGVAQAGRTPSLESLRALLESGALPGSRRQPASLALDRAATLPGDAAAPQPQPKHAHAGGAARLASSGLADVLSAGGRQHHSPPFVAVPGSPVAQARTSLAAAGGAAAASGWRGTEGRGESDLARLRQALGRAAAGAKQQPQHVEQFQHAQHGQHGSSLGGGVGQVSTPPSLTAPGPNAMRGTGGSHASLLQALTAAQHARQAQHGHGNISPDQAASLDLLLRARQAQQAQDQSFADQAATLDALLRARQAQQAQQGQEPTPTDQAGSVERLARAPLVQQEQDQTPADQAASLEALVRARQVARQARLRELHAYASSLTAMQRHASVESVGSQGLAGGATKPPGS